MRRPCNGRQAAFYDAGARCQYIDGPIGRAYSPEPAMTIHRNPMEAPYTQPFRVTNGTSVKVPYQPLPGLSCWRTPAAAPMEIACPIRRNFF